MQRFPNCPNKGVAGSQYSEVSGRGPQTRLGDAAAAGEGKAARAEREFPLLRQSQGKPRREELVGKELGAEHAEQIISIPIGDARPASTSSPPKPPSFCRRLGEGCSRVRFEMGNRGTGHEGCLGLSLPQQHSWEEEEEMLPLVPRGQVCQMPDL